MAQGLLVVDIQNDYFPGGKWELSGIEAASDNALKVMGSFREKKAPLVHIRHEFAFEPAPFFSAGSEGAQIHAKAAAKEGEKVIVKNQVNSFRDTDLKETLDGLSVKQLVIVGNMSHGCIDAATRAAADYGYEVTLVHDACASKDSEFGGVKVPAAQVHASFMASLSGLGYAKLVSTEEFLAA